MKVQNTILYYGGISFCEMSEADFDNLTEEKLIEIIGETKLVTNDPIA